MVRLCTIKDPTSQSEKGHLNDIDAAPLKICDCEVSLNISNHNNTYTTENSFTSDTHYSNNGVDGIMSAKLSIFA